MSFNGFSLAHFSSIRSIGSIVSSFVPRAVEHGLTAVMLLALLFSALVYADGYVLTYSNSSTVPVSYVVQSSQMRLVKIAAPYLLPHGAIKLSGIAPNTKINITLVFNPSHANKLAAFDKAVSTPGSPLYRHYLRRGQFGSLFGADSQTIYLVHKWLGASSLPLGHLSSNQLSISLSTTAARAEHAFSTTLNTIRLPSGRLGYANVTPLMVPAYLLPSLQTVIGMNTTIRPHPFLRLKRSIAYPNFGFNPEALSGKAVTNRSTVSNISFSGPQACSTASQVAASNSSYTADQIATAYNISSFWTRSLFGQGETIALYELEPYLSSDIQAFQSCYGTSTVIQNVSVDGGPGTGAGSGEAVLDIENIIGVAPEAKILVYQAPGSGNGPYDNYSAIINQDLAQVVSTSWGECEQSLPTSYIDAEATLFQQAVSQGQTILAASGDSGSEDCYSSSTPNSPTYLAVDDPGSQPDVTSAGGSSLQALGPPPTQTVWNDSSGASGGGISTIWAMPAWQQSSAVAGVINSYSSNTPCSAPSGSYCREVPDVSASADAAHGYVIYYNSSWDIAGGTSAVAPLWAGVTALINTTCSSPLGFLNPALYKVASAPNSPFGQITQGNNDFTGTNGGKYPAGSGYNMATGLGTPIANLLAADLCGSAPTLTSISPTSGPKAGGTTVTLTGTGFSTTTGSTTVDFGPGNAATSVTCSSTTSCSAVSPSGTGTVSVTVTTLGGTSAGVNYTYTTTSSNAPTLTGISPISGPASGATTVTLTGTNFSTTTSGTTVSFGSNAATSVTCSSTTSCSATSPSGTGTVSVTVTTSGGTSNALSYTYTTYSGYNSLVPYRICDTRSLSVKGTFQNQCTGKTILPGGYLTIQVVGYQGNAASGASIVPNGAMAVVLNVTEADASAPSYLTVYPAGATKPASSSLNFNQTTGAIPNLVQVSLGNTSGCSGCITVYNYNGNTDIAIDVEGYFGPVSQKGQGSFVPLTPYRICDTRSQTLSKITDQCTGKTISAGQTLSVQVSGYQGTAGSPSQAVPQTGGAAVVLNVTEADSNQGGYLTVYPAGTPPVASNLNFAAGEIRPNGVIAELSPTGTVSVYNLSGSTDVIIDVVGYFTSSTSAASFYGTVPYRICDTRSPNGTTIVQNQCTSNGAIAPNSTLSVQVAAYQGTASSLSAAVPDTATAVVLNVTEAGATASGYLTVYPSGALKPATSSLNFNSTTGIIPNFVTVPLSSNGDITVYNHSGNTNVIVDVVGWYG